MRMHGAGRPARHCSGTGHSSMLAMLQLRTAPLDRCSRCSHSSPPVHRCACCPAPPRLTQRRRLSSRSLPPLYVMHPPRIKRKKFSREQYLLFQIVVRYVVILAGDLPLRESEVVTIAVQNLSPDHLPEVMSATSLRSPSLLCNILYRKIFSMLFFSLPLNYIFNRKCVNGGVWNKTKVKVLQYQCIWTDTVCKKRREIHCKC